MTTTSAERIPQSEQITSDADSLTHAVHAGCQEGRPHVTALCGAHLAWDGEIPLIRATPRDICVVCIHLDTCPVCGWKVRA